MSTRAIIATLFACGLAAVIPGANKSALASQCSDITLNGAWLVSNCLKDNSSSTRVKSAVYLGNHIANGEGKLKVSSALRH